MNALDQELEIRGKEFGVESWIFFFFLPGKEVMSAKLR